MASVGPQRQTALRCSFHESVCSSFDCNVYVSYISLIFTCRSRYVRILFDSAARSLPQNSPPNVHYVTHRAFCYCFPFMLCVILYFMIACVHCIHASLLVLSFTVRMLLLKYLLRATGSHCRCIIMDTICGCVVHHPGGLA